MKHKCRAEFGSLRCRECGKRLVVLERPEMEECKEGQHLLPTNTWDGLCINCGRFCWKLPGDLGAYIHGPKEAA